MEPTTTSSTDFFEARKHRIPGYRSPRPRRERYWLHLLLFLLTLASTVYVGGQLVGRMAAYGLPFDAGLMDVLLNRGFLLDGLRFGGSLLLFLTIHEFGHYFAARYYGIDTSLPYYIPTLIFGFGTLGAVIRIREPIPSTRKLFDVGAAGPLAGFVMALVVVLYAFATLPPLSYITDLSGHEALKWFIQEYGRFPDLSMNIEAPPGVVPEETDAASFTLLVGQTPLFWMLSQFFEQVPPMDEIYHYPVLFAGWMGLFFTALNLLPVGQLDGGHILYALVGHRWHSRLARGFVVLLLASGSVGFVVDMFPELTAYNEQIGRLGWFILAGILYFFLTRVFGGDHRVIAPTLLGLIAFAVVARHVPWIVDHVAYSPWFVWCLLIVFLIQVDHPPVVHPEPLTPARRVLAVLSILIFVLCFSFRPLAIL